jgi:tetraacyldisaccharide 4'-kinase
VRQGLERWLARRWYGEVPPGFGLRALAGAFRVARGLRGQEAPQRLPVPVLVAGNFTAGGTGTTPLVIALARELSARGWRPGIVSRGHGRHSEQPVRVEDDTPVADCGDEPKLIRDLTGLPVFVDRDRVAAARAAIAAGCNLVIADDGLQHRRLGRDLEIEVVDGERGYGNGLLLPAGPLRVAPRATDFRVVNGASGPGESPAEGDWPIRLRLREAVSLTDDSTRRSLSAFAGAPVHAVAGIGNPQRFFNALHEAAGLQLIEHPFPDHHDFERADFRDIKGTVLMTEKDAVKCRGLGLRDAWSVPAEAELPAAFYDAIAARLETGHARA